LVASGVEDVVAGRAQRVEGEGGIGEGDLQRGSGQGEWGAQFVGSVGDEALLGVEGGFQAGEQFVDGLAKVRQLVAWSMKGQPLVEVVLGDASGGGRDRAQWP
jgi:hypothetical protein